MNLAVCLWRLRAVASRGICPLVASYLLASRKIRMHTRRMTRMVSGSSFQPKKKHTKAATHDTLKMYAAQHFLNLKENQRQLINAHCDSAIESTHDLCTLQLDLDRPQIWFVLRQRKQAHDISTRHPAQDLPSASQLS